MLWQALKGLNTMATIAVSNATELSSALASYSGDTTIMLSPGSYGAVRYSGIGTRGALTLTSADPNNKAVFEDLQFDSSQNVTIDSVAFNPQQFSGQTFGGWGLSFRGGSNFHVENSNFYGEHGSLAKVSGVYIRDVSGVSIENNTFSDLQYGIQGLTSANVNILDNNLTGIRADGMQFSSAQHVEIARNFGTNFATEAGAHPDLIQFHTADGSLPASMDVKIHNNAFLQGSGTGAQGIFMGNESGTRYQDITVSDNLIYTSYWHGISVYGADGVLVDNNTVIGVPNNALGGDDTWVRLSGATGAIVTDNITNSVYMENGTSGTSAGNVLTHWKAKPGTLPYDQVLANAWAGASAEIDDFAPTSGYSGKGVTPSDLADVGYEIPDASPTPAEPTLSGLIGAPPTHVINDGSGHHTIGGTSARDWIDGNLGNDTINGGAGDDWINGGGFNDSLTGGRGADVFIFDAHDIDGPLDTDRIADVNFGQGDIIAFTDFAVGTFKESVADTIALENGTSAYVNSFEDLKELDMASSAISAAEYNRGTNDLRFTVIDADGQTQTIRIVGGYDDWLIA
jgi:hypothetical protein